MLTPATATRRGGGGRAELATANARRAGGSRWAFGITEQIGSVCDHEHEEARSYGAT